jgi:hypothetical protein
MCSGTVYDESGMGNNGKLQGNILTEGGLLDDNGLDLSQGKHAGHKSILEETA